MIGRGFWLVVLMASIALFAGCANQMVDKTQASQVPGESVLSQSAVQIAQLSQCDNHANDQLEINPDAATTILVHGCNPEEGRFQSLSREFVKYRQQTYCFHYDDRKSLDDVADEFVAVLNKLDSRLRNKHVTVLAHSQGGLISRRALTGERKSNLSATSLDLRLITLSSPFHGMEIAKHCSWPILAVATLGATIGICWAISGGKWYEITAKSDFMKVPGTLVDHVRSHIRVATDEKDYCLARDPSGTCVERDFLFTLAEQKNTIVDGDARVTPLELKEGHSHVIGGVGEPPVKLIELLQRERVLASFIPRARQDFLFSAARAPETEWLW